MKLCSWCDNTFKPTVSYQIYCSAECRNEATKEKVIERQKILRRKKSFNKKKPCIGGCGTILSPYNDSGFCSSCNVNPKHVVKALKELKRLGIIEHEQE